VPEYKGSVGVAVLTISTSRYEGLKRGESVKDPSGDIVSESLKRDGYRLVRKEILPDDLNVIRDRVKELIELKDVDVVITIGGTGLTEDDVTIEAIRPLIEKEMPGFGEALRAISYRKVGCLALLSRAMAGTLKRKAVFCLPGSPDAVRTALDNLIKPLLPHLLYLLKRPSKNGKVG